MAAICYGLALAIVGGWLYAWDVETVQAIGGGVLAVGGVCVIWGLVGLGRALTGAEKVRSDIDQTS